MDTKLELATLRKLSVEGRLAYLQRLIGPHTKNPLELHERAMFVTEAVKAGLWPMTAGRRR